PLHHAASSVRGTPFFMNSSSIFSSRVSRSSSRNRALTHGQRRFLAGVLTAVYANPVPEGAFVDTELLRHSGDRARRLDHHLHGFVLEFRREALLRSGQLLHLSRLSILMDGLSGRLGAPHGFVEGGPGSGATSS